MKLKIAHFDEIIFREKLLSNYNQNSNILYSYISGPNSAYGVGNTSARLDIKTLTLTKDANNKTNIPTQYSGETEDSGIYYKNTSYNSSDPYVTTSPITIYNSKPSPITYTNGYGDTVIISGSFKDQNREDRVGSGRQDLINLTPLFANKADSIGDNIKINNVDYNINDLVKFRIQTLDNDDSENNTWMIFRAYLTNFDDTVTANWNEFKYAGRGEDFFTYQGFSRIINIGFKVATLSAVEMKPMYDKLNYLMSCLMPDYSAGGTMRGNIVII
jgi:hypothetical protein